MFIVCYPQIEKGKFHGSVDVGLSFVTYKRDGRRIDIDAEDLIYHLKVNFTTETYITVKTRCLYLHIFCSKREQVTGAVSY